MKTYLIAICTLVVIANSLLAQTTDLKQNKKFSLKGKTLVYNTNLSTDPDRNYITFDDAKVFKKYLDENNIKTLRLTS